jgi:hypothetical protein
MGDKEKESAAYDEQSVINAIQQSYKLVEGNDSQVVEKAFVFCNRAVSLMNTVRVYISAEHNNERNGAAGLRESDIELNPESFGVCEVISGRCMPEIEGNKWQECDQTQKINGEAGVTINSYMVCLKGGIIVPMNDGQRIGINNINLNSEEYEKIKIWAKKWNIDEKLVRWKNSDFIFWQIHGKDEFLHSKKIEFITQYRDVIKDAAKVYDLPEILIAGVVYNEYAGDPMFVDDIAYMIRSFDWCGPDWIDDNLTITRNPDLTSFGNVSIQVRRAWESLGYEKEQVTSEIKKEIIDSLKNPVENIYISSKHISDLRDMQYPNKKAENLTEDEMRVIATRYNRGPDLSLETILSDTSYGNRIFANKIDIETALEELENGN